ncbi:hypothetical protein [Acetivibrio cellulolyticus]|uniref:hypothetical protein n=1 Tax=Acetivibrio cellulolyticus TaxID=35830 RepID=UPI0002D6F5C2|nr:hypothetical protein [Acetivibrio cellulolyticus]
MRNDVFDVYPQYGNKNSGFHYMLDTVKLFNGKYTLKVVEIGSSWRTNNQTKGHNNK